MAAENGCCEPVDLTQLNPKTVRPGRGSRVNIVRFSQPANPIPAQIEDSEELSEFFLAFKDKLVPYAGTDQYTSHALLYFLMDLAENSPTQGAVIQSMKAFAFGGRVDIVRRIDPVFNIEPDAEVGPGEKLAFRDFLAESVKWHGNDDQETDLRTFAGYNFEDLKKTGNLFIELVLVTGPEKRAFVYSHSPAHCLHVAVKRGEQRYIAISPIWTEAYIRDNPPTVLPLFPGYVDQGGVLRTIFQIKEGNHVWYGRPNSISSLLYQFREFQDADYLIKQTHSQFIGQALIELEDENPELDDSDKTAARAGFDDLADQIEQNHTNKSEDPLAIMLVTRPYGAGNAFVYQFQPNTNENWYQVNSDIAEAKIILSHGWSKRMMGENEATGFSTNVFLDEFEIKAATTLRYYQNTIGNLHNQIITEVARFMGRPEVEQFSIDYQSPYTEMLRQRQEQAQALFDQQIGGGDQNEEGDEGDAD